MSHRKARRVRRTPEQIAAIVHEFHASGRSRAAFARERGLPLSTFDLWLRKHSQPARGPEPATAFVAVELPHLETARYEVVFPSGVRLLVPIGFDADELVALVSAVARC